MGFINFVYRTLGRIFALIRFLAQPIFKLIYEKQRLQLPAINSPLLTKDAVTLSRMIRRREVTSEKVVEAFISRIKETNPIVNAVVANRFNEALQEAQHVDSILDADNVAEQYNEENAPFLGVPFTAKEAFAITGMPNTSGLLKRKNHVASSDAETVQLMRKAGAIPIGLTNCSELCMWFESSNLLYGRTNNAYHTGRIVGGSSGGEGCVLSVGGSPFGIGSDIGGSIRMPCFFNGVFGHKPTTGVVSNEGQFPKASGEAIHFLSTGPMCRFASDLIPMLKVLAGPTLSKVRLDEKVDLTKLKVYYMVDDGGSVMLNPVDPQIKNSVAQVAEHFRNEVGATVKEVNLEKMKLSMEIWSTKMATSGDTAFSVLMGDGTHVNCFYELLRWLLFCPRHTLAAIGLGIIEDMGQMSGNDLFIGMCTTLKEEFKELLGKMGYSSILLIPK